MAVYVPPEIEVSFTLVGGYTPPTNGRLDFELGTVITSVRATFNEPYSSYIYAVHSFDQEWIYYTYAYRAFDLPWILPPPLAHVFEEFYSFSTDNIKAIEEIWGISRPNINFVSEIYGLKMGITCVEWYGDKPVSLALINEYYADSSILKRIISLRYSDALVPIKNFIELYEDKPCSVSSKILPYTDSPVATEFYMEFYNDAPFSISSKDLLYGNRPTTLKTYAEFYGDTSVLYKAIEQRYNDALLSRNQVTELYVFTTGATLVVNESWGISSTDIIASFEQNYELENLNKITNDFSMPYYLVSETSVENTVSVSVEVNGTPIDFFSVDIEAGMDKYVIIGNMELASEVDYQNCPVDGEVACIIDGVTFNLFIETRGKKKTNATGATWAIDMISPTAKLDSPYSKTMVKSFTDGIYASALVQQMADYQSIAVDWDIIDWAIPNYAISANDETPFAVIKKVVNAVGGIIQTKPNGDMLITSKYPVSPTLWDVTIPSVIFSSETDIVSIADSMIINEGKNAFLITDQGSSAADIKLVEIDVDGTTKIIRGFRVPFDSGPFELVTSGGPTISVVKDSSYIEASLPGDFTEDEEEWEYVEFIDWVGTTNFPIYEIIDWEWVAEDMGAFQISENGTLTAITQDDSLKESLLRIKYKTKYWKWTVRGPLNAYAQVYVPELETI